MRILAVTCAAVALAFPGAAVADQAAAPVRHLVYDFTFTTSGSLTVHSSGIGEGEPGSGMTNYGSGVSDKGSITVDVTHVQPDGGLIVSIWEDARETRSAKPATCEVYGDTRAICQPEKKVNEEEYTLLGFIGRNFVDPNKIDDKNHWRIANASGNVSMTADFTVNKNDAGMLQISEQQVMKQGGAQALSQTSDRKISYNLNLSVPAAISEDTMVREDRGMGQYNTQHTQISLTLTSDSKATSKQ